VVLSKTFKTTVVEKKPNNNKPNETVQDRP